MRFLEESVPMTKIYDVLYELDITGNYVGFFHTSYAIWLCIQQPERLLLVTKWLYPDVAKYYGTTWTAVEGSIRRVAAASWENYPDRLSQFAGEQLTKKPTPAQFLKIMVGRVSPDAVA